MKLKTKLAALTLAANFFLVPALHADLRIVPMVGFNAPLVVQDPEPTDLQLFAPDLGFSGGAMVGFKTIPTLLIETGFLYNQRKYSEIYIGTSSGQVSYEFQEYEIPFLVRLNLAMFSIGAGGFYTNAMSDITVTMDRKVVPKTTTTYTFDESNITTSNYGLLFAAGLDMKPPGVPVGVIADIRYRLPMKEISKVAEVSRKMGGFEFLLGVAFYL